MKFAAAAKVIGSPIRGDDKYWGTVSDADGKNAIGIPSHRRHFGKFTVKEQQWKEIGSDLGGGYKYSGGIIAKDGCLYCAPANANRIAKLNIESQQISFVGDLYDGDNKWDGCVMGNDGNIYFIPSNHSHVMKLDVKSGQTFLVGDDFGDDGYKWSGGAVGSDGCLYFVPHNAKRVLRVDIVNGTTTMIGDSYDGDLKWMGCIASRKNHILYCCPYNTSQILMINIVDQTTSLIGEDLRGNGIWKWSGFVKDHSNYIYGIPLISNRVLFFDPKTHRTALIGDDFGYGNEKWCGAALTEDGSIHAMPSYAEKVLKITPFLTRWKTAILNDIVQCNSNSASFINVLALKGDVADAADDVNERSTVWKSFEESIENNDHARLTSRVHTSVISIQGLQHSINKMEDDEYFIIAMYDTNFENEIKEMIVGNHHILCSCHDLFIEDDGEHRRKRPRLNSDDCAEEDSEDVEDWD